MRTPVIIAAHNEEHFIGRALGGLDPDTCEPIVVVNGSMDRTAEIARSYGVSVLEKDEPGKLPAIQDGLRMLGDRALEPVLFMDADSYPRFPRRWSRTMTEPMAGATSVVVAGNIGYCDGRKRDSIPRNAKRIVAAYLARRSETTVALFGANMSIKLGTPTMRDIIVEQLPHIWPGEDRAMADEMIKNGAVLHQALDVRSLVHASARKMPSLRLFTGTTKREAMELCSQDYEGRAQPGVVSAYRDGRYVPRRKSCVLHAGDDLNDSDLASVELSSRGLESRVVVDAG